jgi:hypothetical protein
VKRASTPVNVVVDSITTRPMTLHSDPRPKARSAGVGEPCQTRHDKTATATSRAA